MDLDMALLIVQLLGGITLGGLAWYGQRAVARLDSMEARLAAVEASDKVFDVRLQSAATPEGLRAVLREELLLALAPIHRDMDDLRSRMRKVEERGLG